MMPMPSLRSFRTIANSSADSAAARSLIAKLGYRQEFDDRLVLNSPEKSPLLSFAARRGPLRKRALRREALTQLRAAGALPPGEVLPAQALLLRRLARTLGGEATMQLQGEAWLAALDSLFATRFFTLGQGRRFGDQLYAPAAPAAAALDAELTKLVKRLRWPA